MVTFEQAAVIIPGPDLQAFFNRNGLQLKTKDARQIGAYMQQIVQSKGKPALDDLQNLCKASLKKMMDTGGCGCGGKCGGCGDKKTLNADGDHTLAAPASQVTVVKEDNKVISFAKKNPLAAIAIVIAGIWVLKQL